ncbi:arabinan endo-1,5-alpha-L-arabinosidase [Robertkochia solimangrovi]|uniref:arabinan endo-1,5-alpha-L-arabinosidase n=1 Tax=Robertkochia solimangrovi TaxID=2213046 RepID=UPI00117E2265|nr:arabinan endo-1,5-alpha-L-arabinosidase [Robertkochia solimangrovi]TRZ45910.1 arabinan endo-1,5-alpha-L-arabinosidase [Robertkochia solimangrovi]
MKKNKCSIYVLIPAIIFTGLSFTGCSKDSPADPDAGKETPEISEVPEEPEEETGFDFSTYADTYGELAPVENVYRWGPYNVHDPSVVKEGDTYYLYNTDVAYGAEVKPGIQIRKSKDLLKWDFVGWVFDGIPAKGSQFIKSKGGEPFQALWAPFIYKYGNEYRLYYSLSSAVPRLSVIGLATASSPLGPWTEKGLVVTSQDDATVQTNAIDPTVVVTPTGEHWFYYGSAWDGIYRLPLDPATGLALNSGFKGERVAQRGFTGGIVNGNIEGAEVIYNESLDKYFMFISYDWLQTKYNVRVGRSDTPEGPFLDYNGNDINTETDNFPMILAPYKFDGHSGWQGVSHPAVFNDGGGQYFMAHQGRPGIDSYYMVLHVRKIHWTEDGWPIVSPERYAMVESTGITNADLAGTYEQIILGYTVVPGYDKEQTSPDFQTSISLVLGTDGTLNGDSGSTWSYDAPWLTLSWANGYTDILYAEFGRDWENNVVKTVLLSGLNNDGTAIWGKKIN